MEETCPVDQKQKANVERYVGSNERLVTCSLCGKFVITELALHEIEARETHKKDLRHLLMCYCREKWEYAQISAKDTRWGAEIREADVARIAEGKDPDMATTAKARENKLLTWLSLRSRPGSPASIDQHKDYPIAYARDAWELVEIVNDLCVRKLIRWFGGNTVRSEITPAGQRHIEAEDIPNPLSTIAFVAMSLQPEHSYVHENAWNDAIKPAIEACGWIPYRVDKSVEERKICDAIVLEIRSSRFVVADVTGERPCVYYEAGYAMGSGIKVIWLAEKGTRLHFDSNHYQHIIWTRDGLDKLRADLEEHIQQRIGSTSGR